MILVSGATRTLAGYLHHPRLGCLLTPDIARPAHLRLARASGCWAADNSAFARFDPGRFCSFLGRIARLPGCLWVSAPDVVADARQTLARFDRWQPVITEVGLPVAYVAQDGSEELDLPWGRLACLFVGGSTGWKLSRASEDLIGETRRRGRWVHVGRVNSRKRVRWCAAAGADSLDGSGFGRFPRVNIPRGLAWLAEVDPTAGSPACSP